MASGWVKLYRSLMDNDLWQDKPFARGQAWVDIIMLASHKDTEFWLDGENLTLERGEFIGSIRQLSERWGWSRTKTKRFIDELESAQMLIKKCAAKKTTFKVVNYEKYQGFEDSLENIKSQSKSHRKATEKPQKDTFNNNNNNITSKEIKEKNKKEKLLEQPSDDVKSDPDDDDEWLTGDELQAKWDAEGGPYGTV